MNKNTTMEKDITTSLVQIALLHGLSPKELALVCTDKNGDRVPDAEKAISKYAQTAISRMGFDENDDPFGVFEDMPLTTAGYREFRDFLREAAAQRKELLDSGKDTADDTTPLSWADILTDTQTCFGEDLDDEFTNRYGITDNNVTYRPLTAKFGKHLLFPDKRCWPTSYNGCGSRRVIRISVEDLRIGASAEVYADAIIPAKVCLLSLGNSEIPADCYACRFDTENGPLLVAVKPNR